MNKFKSLLLLCMCFAFAAFPLSNQGFCNGDPILIVESLADCTGDVTVTQVCNSDGSVTVTITLANSTGDDATATVVADGANPQPTVSGSPLGSPDGSFTTTIPDGSDHTSLNIAVNITGGSCNTAIVNPAPNPVTIIPCAPSTCTTCFSGDGVVENTPTGFCNEICGALTETFQANGSLQSNGTIGVTPDADRDIIFNFTTFCTLGTPTDGSGNYCFEVALGSTLLVDFATPTCTPFAPDNNETSFTTTPVNNTQVKIAPNPVTNIAQIQYTLAEEGRVQVSVFDMKGNRVAIVANGHQFSGVHTVDFDASNLARGFYYLTVQTANTQVTERMVIVK